MENTDTFEIPADPYKTLPIEHYQAIADHAATHGITLAATTAKANIGETLVVSVGGSATGQKYKFVTVEDVARLWITVHHCGWRRTKHQRKDGTPQKSGPYKSTARVFSPLEWIAQMGAIEIAAAHEERVADIRSMITKRLTSDKLAAIEAILGS